MSGIARQGRIHPRDEFRRDEPGLRRPPRLHPLAIERQVENRRRNRSCTAGDPRMESPSTAALRGQLHQRQR